MKIVVTVHKTCVWSMFGEYAGESWKEQVEPGVYEFPVAKNWESAKDRSNMNGLYLKGMNRSDRLGQVIYQGKAWNPWGGTEQWAYSYSEYSVGVRVPCTIKDYVFVNRIGASTSPRGKEDHAGTSLIKIPQDIFKWGKITGPDYDIELIIREGAAA